MSAQRRLRVERCKLPARVDGDEDGAERRVDLVGEEPSVDGVEDSVLARVRKLQNVSAAPLHSQRAQVSDGLDSNARARLFADLKIKQKNQKRSKFERVSLRPHCCSCRACGRAQVEVASGGTLALSSRSAGGRGVTGLVERRIVTQISITRRDNDQ